MAKKTNYEIKGKNYYRLRCDIGVDNNGKRIRKVFYGSSMKDAEAKRDKYLAGIKKGLSHDYDKIIFSDLFDEWFNEVLKPTVSASTIQKYETIYRLRISTCPFFNDPLNKLKSIDIQSYYNQVAKDSVAKVIELNKLIGHFINYCLEEDLLIKDIMKAVKIPKETQPKEELLFLSKEGQEKLILAANDEPHYFIFVFALLTGLRQGEIIALTFDDVMDNTITVKKSMRMIKDIESGNYHRNVGKTKTKSGMREVPISKTLKPMLERHILREKAKHLKLGIKFTTDHYLFTTSIITAQDPSNIRRLWIKCLEDINEPYIKFHALRHTFCSNLASAGVNLKYAAALMGHSDFKLTAKIYTHFTAEDLSNEIDKMDQRMASSNY